MAWYEEWFNDDKHQLVYGHRDDADAERLVDLIVSKLDIPPNGRVLDVGCGRGRHARMFARRGYEVTGLDLADKALDVARQRAASEGLGITFLHGDMREPVADGVFDLVVNLFTAFGYFRERTEHIRALRAMVTAAKVGAYVVQDFMNAVHVRSSFVPTDDKTVDGVHIRQERRVLEGRIEKTITLTQNDDIHVVTESVALLDQAAFTSFYDEVGLDLLHTFGDYDGDPFTPTSPRLVLMSRRQPRPGA